MKPIKKIKYIFKKKTVRVQAELLPLGFHGDQYLLALSDSLLKNTDVYIETGANVGSTLSYIGRRYPDIKCLSCEPEKQAFDAAVTNISALGNVFVYNETSQQFLERIKEQYSHFFNKRVLFWLDAHDYGFKWPLKHEIRFITKMFQTAYILIDDFKVPELECFKWDKYKGQECSFEYIKSSIKKDLQFQVYYPSYTEKTSAFHPLTGWGLIEFGQKNEIQLPRGLQDKIQRVI